MELKKKDFLFLFLLGVMLSPRPSQALALSASAAETPEAPPVTSPICDVEAVVLDAAVSPQADYYDIALQIQSISAYKSETSSACSASYGTQMEKSGLILSAAEYQTVPLTKGDTIKAMATFDGNGAVTGYFLHDVQVTGKTATTGSGAGNQVAAPETSDCDETPLIAFSIVSIMALAAMAYNSHRAKK